MENKSMIFKRVFYDLWNKVIETLPSVLIALAIIVIGVLLAYLASFIIKKIIKGIFKTRIARKIELPINESTGKSIELVDIIGKFTYWVVVLLFIVIATESLGWEVVSEEIGTLFRYLPKLLSGVIILILGLYIARFIKSSLNGTMSSLKMSGAKTLSSVAFYVIMIFVTITALNQIGVHTEIINQNITLIIGSVLLAFAIAFAIASKNVLESFISGTYARNNLKLGARVKINDIEGIIESIDKVSITLRSENELHIIPLKKLAKTNYKVIEEEEKEL